MSRAASTLWALAVLALLPTVECSNDPASQPVEQDNGEMDVERESSVVDVDEPDVPSDPGNDGGIEVSEVLEDNEQRDWTEVEDDDGLGVQRSQTQGSDI